MDLWTAIVSIVALGVTAGTISQIIQSKQKVASKQADALSKEIEERIKKIEDRMANLETVLLREEKSRKFDDL
ncbi:MAG: hypothetical protein AAGB46_03160 [Verrucomicrobiota bacterium]